MGLPSQPEQVLDKRFFHITGVAMVLATLVAGAITVWLANDIRMSHTSLIIARGMGNQTSALQKPQTFAGPVNEVNFRINSNEMVSNSR